MFIVTVVWRTLGVVQCGQVSIGVEKVWTRNLYSQESNTILSQPIMIVVQRSSPISISRLAQLLMKWSMTVSVLILQGTFMHRGENNMAFCREHSESERVLMSGIMVWTKRKGRREREEEKEAEWGVCSSLHVHHVSAQPLVVGKPTQDVSKVKLWEFAQKIVFRGNTQA